MTHPDTDDFRDQHERAFRDHILGGPEDHHCDDLCSAAILDRLLGKQPVNEYPFQRHLLPSEPDLAALLHAERIGCEDHRGDDPDTAVETHREQALRLRVALDRLPSEPDLAALREAIRLRLDELPVWVHRPERLPGPGSESAKRFYTVRPHEVAAAIDAAFTKRTFGRDSRVVYDPALAAANPEPTRDCEHRTWYDDHGMTRCEDCRRWRDEIMFERGYRGEGEWQWPTPTAPALDVECQCRRCREAREYLDSDEHRRYLSPAPTTEDEPQ